MHDRRDADPLTPAATGTAVSVRNVRRVYDNGVVALDGVTFDVAAGEFLAVLGPSGGGKSTLLRLIAGLDEPQAGSVLVEATPSSPGPVGARPASPGAPAPIDPGLLELRATQAPPLWGRQHRRHDVAYVFQDAHLLPWRNVLRNVELPLELAGVSRAARRNAAQSALDLVQVPPHLYPAQLSGGMRMRASLARALVTRPRLLLLDEPFAALDEITRQRLDEHLRHLWSQTRVTVVFVTHSITEAVFLAQRAIVLSRRPGRVILDRRIDLPESRSQELRTTSAFAREQAVLFDALKGEEDA
jgi:NitT/TauT family transport system ATP-binding protein